MSPRFSSRYLPEGKLLPRLGPTVPASSGLKLPPDATRVQREHVSEELLLSQCGCWLAAVPLYLAGLPALPPPSGAPHRTAAAWPDRYPPRDVRGALGDRLDTLFSLSTTFLSLSTTFSSQSTSFSAFSLPVATLDGRFAELFSSSPSSQRKQRGPFRAQGCSFDFKNCVPCSVCRWVNSKLFSPRAP